MHLLAEMTAGEAWFDEPECEFVEERSNAVEQFGSWLCAWTGNEKKRKFETVTTLRAAFTCLSAAWDDGPTAAAEVAAAVRPPHPPPERTPNRTELLDESPTPE